MSPRPLTGRQLATLRKYGTDWMKAPPQAVNDGVTENDRRIALVEMGYIEYRGGRYRLAPAGVAYLHDRRVARK